jgi:hypothetical protein
MSVNVIQYLNTDLDLVSDTDLTTLAAALESRGLFALHVDRRDDGLWHASFEVNLCGSQPETTIGLMLYIIESLDEPLRQTWQVCLSREFNIGYECGAEPWAFNQALSTQTLRRMVDVGASLRITLYPPASADLSEIVEDQP